MLGVTPARAATCFPCEVTVAGAWDTALAAEIGRAIAREALSCGVGCVLGPGVNIKRSPLGGRNFEYYSEDPLLAGELAAAFIRGMEAEGAAACPKHFAANSQEFSRFCSDSVVDERTLREIYLAAFERAVKRGRPGAVMCAYNRLNGVYCSDNRRLLTDILPPRVGLRRPRHNRLGRAGRQARRLPRRLRPLHARRQRVYGARGPARRQEGGSLTRVM